MLISPALFLSWASRLSRCFLSVDCLWPLVQGMLSPAISPRCINNNSNYSHSNQSVAPASRGLSREQIDRHLKSHIDCVAKKNTHTHTQTHSWMGLRGMGGQIVSLGGKIDVNEYGWLRKQVKLWVVNPLWASCCFIIDKFWFLNTCTSRRHIQKKFYFVWFSRNKWFFLIDRLQQKSSVGTADSMLTRNYLLNSGGVVVF